MTEASDLSAWIETLLGNPAFLRMGHNQRADDQNLGLGWLYYAFGRIVRPKHTVVIGSYRGFVPLILGKASSDNLEGGRLTFIDPSMVDGFWTDPKAVEAHFEGLGVHNVEHHPMTTQAFVETDAYQALDSIGLLFVDGYHTAEQARFDHEAFRHLLEPRATVLFHDSMVRRESKIYGSDRAYQMDVPDYIAELRRDPTLQVLDVPFGTGVTIVSRRDVEAAGPRTEGVEGRVRDAPSA
jgi:predicted O-methyltransferase YrrM